jgi:putative GTP pyrophosphokinase
VTAPDPHDLVRVRDELTRFLMSYKFGIDELMTKVNILQEEFEYLHHYSPIEHVNSRLKSPESILRKAVRKGIPLTLDDIREQICDIAGVRVTCSFISDTYRIRDMLAGQADVRVVEERDYIANPKPNGYQSLHLIVDVPVFMSDREVAVRVEIQIRTIAMDFWASLEHKIYYKYDREVPPALLAELKDTADVATRLDLKMERLHKEVERLDPQAAGGADARTRDLGDPLPQELLEAFAQRGLLGGSGS